MTDAYDVVVIGGGVLGTAVAARLSATTASVCLLEAGSDVAEGASKGNAGVAVSYYGPPGTPQTRLITASTPRWEEVTSRLSVPYRRLGAIMVALDDEQAHHLEETHAEILACGVRAELITAARARREEPLITDRCVAALLMPDEGVIDPIALTCAYADLAATNGVSVRLGSPVIAIRTGEDGRHDVITPYGTARCRFIVNAAGVHAGRISSLAGGEQLRCWPRKGQYAVLDRAFAEALRRIVFSTHSATTKGINVVPTAHGSALLGPTASDHGDPGDTATDAETLAMLVASASRLVPSITDDLIIKHFAANRPASDEPHRLRFDRRVPTLLHCTNRSAGVSISPAAAGHALDLLNSAGLEARPRPGAAHALPPAPRLRHHDDPAELIAADPRYGQVVCACEQVSAAEINRALGAPVPATSMDGVRKRTGAAYGRCQGSLCSAEISLRTAMHTHTGPATVKQTARDGRLVTGTIVVVGAGPSGLGCATALARARKVVVVDRIPVVGGTAGWDHPAIRAYARELDVPLRLGETAIRWSGRHLLLAGPGAFSRVAASHLFFAGGLRPATAAGLGLTGDRPAGVLPATVAQHLLRAGEPRWRRVAVLGDGHWAEAVARRARRLGARIIGIGDATPWADEHHPRPQAWSVTGRRRVTSITLDEVTVDCDAVVLADRPVPNRNVDGAVLPSSDGVTFVQPIAPADCRARFDDAHAVAAAWLETQGEFGAR